ncbi:hypothetical protein YPPY13_1332, partial [Yersinia pestis PY-13]
MRTGLRSAGFPP